MYLHRRPIAAAMPFRIDVLDPALTPERRAALAGVLVAHGVEREVADLVCAMTPGTVAEVGTESHRDRLTSALMESGFGVRVASTDAPAGHSRVAPDEAPDPVVARPPGRSPIPRTALIISGFFACLLGIVWASTTLGTDTSADVDTTVTETPALPLPVDATPMAEDDATMMESSPNEQSWVTSSPTGYVNVREWGSIHAPVVNQINNGNVITTDRCDYAAAENKTWCRSSVNGVAGWIGQVNLRVAGSPESSF